MTVLTLCPAERRSVQQVLEDAKHLSAVLVIGVDENNVLYTDDTDVPTEVLNWWLDVIKLDTLKEYITQDEE